MLLSMCFLILIVGSGFAYGDDESPTHCHGFNEEVQCRFACPPELSCLDRSIKVNCFRPEDEVCNKKCVCKDGFYRSSKRDCITAEQCDMCTGPNEYFACGSACDNECSLLHVQNRTNCPIVNFVCNKKCYCEDNFARDSQNKCIPIDKCKNL